MSLIGAFSRLTVTAVSATGVRAIHRTPAAWFQLTPMLCAEPLKKKKKLDPQIIKQREERRRKKLEKQIRRLEKNARQLKPIEELEVPMELIDEKEKRARKLPPLNAAELEVRAHLKNQWAQYKHAQKLADFQVIDRLVQSQRKALQELRLESEELYQEAIQMDLALLPITMKGPVATPPIKNYESPDGEYIHQAKKWE